MEKFDPHSLYTSISQHKTLISFDLNENLLDDAKEVYSQARNELQEALAKTDQGSDVYNRINQALGDLKPEPKDSKELIENYNQAIKDLGPLC